MLFLIFYILLYIPVQDTSIHENRLLFFIERSKDDNRIIYEVNLEENGQLNQSNPLKIYWIKATKNNRREELSWIQSKYAYGIKILYFDQESPRISFCTL